MFNLKLLCKNNKTKITSSLKSILIQDKFYQQTVKFYHPVRELMEKKNPAFYSDPNEIGEQIIRIISLHDKCKDPSKVTMGSTFEEIGLDSLDFVEIVSEVEYEFGYDFGPSDWEQFITINDIAQFMARDYFAQKH
jgi:acyl carrier protein